MEDTVRYSQFKDVEINIPGLFHKNSCKMSLLFLLHCSAINTLTLLVGR